MTVSAHREAISVALEAINGLTVYREWTHEFAFPAALVDHVRGDYAQSFQGGLTIQFGVLILLSTLASPVVNWMSQIDEFIEPKGPRSVDQVLRATGGSSGYYVASFEGPGPWDTLGKQYFGVHFTLGSVYL